MPALLQVAVQVMVQRWVQGQVQVLVWQLAQALLPTRIQLWTLPVFAPWYQR